MIIDSCRACANRELLPVLDLGSQALTGVYPRSRTEVVPTAPLELVRCSPAGCGLVQLRHTTDPGLMFHAGYGYRSSIRPYMVDHLHAAVSAILRRVDVGPGDLVLDIGSNDGTLLHGYPGRGPTLVGVDPVGERFRDRYPPRADLIPGFFSRQAFTDRYGTRRAKVVTSIAMFYDLPRPLEFMTDVRDVLADDGVWLIEQSYLPAMLANSAFDTACHEHLEYYALRQIEWMAERAGLTVLTAEINDVYGGSLRVLLARRPGRYPVDERGLALLRRRESDLGLATERPYAAFAESARLRRDELCDLLDRSAASGLLTLGYGASAKGNVILQFCGLGPDLLPCVGDVDREKSGCFTPGTLIPIVSEDDAKALDPDQLLILPWIYRDGFLARERDALARGVKMIFPLPALSVVGRTHAASAGTARDSGPRR